MSEEFQRPFGRTSERGGGSRQGRTGRTCVVISPLSPVIHSHIRAVIEIRRKNVSQQVQGGSMACTGKPRELFFCAIDPAQGPSDGAAGAIAGGMGGGAEPSTTL